LYYSTDDATYWYEIHGENGIPLVMLHGFTGSTKTWNFLIEKQNPNLQLIVIDLPGHGKTITENPKSMKTCCRDLQQLFNHIGLTKFHLLGYSMGGRTALSFAVNYPNYVKSLILESASPGLEDEKDREARVIKDENLAARLETEGIDEFVNFWENIPLFESQKRLPEEIQQTIRSERLSQSESGLAGSLRSMGTGTMPSWWHLLGKMDIPVLLLVGELDAKFVAINRKMNEIIPHSKLIICKDAGHAVHIENREEFIKRVMDFLHKEELKWLYNGRK